MWTIEPFEVEQDDIKEADNNNNDDNVASLRIDCAKNLSRFEQAV